VQTVTWSIRETSTKAGTGISVDGGLLTVAADEALTTLTVVTTSTVDASKSGEKAVTVDSIKNAATPVISVQPQDQVYGTNSETANPLTVIASAADGGTLSYQWYSNTKNDTTDGTLITDATSNAYTPSIPTGSVYYYVVVTNTNNNATTGKTAATTSAVAEVRKIDAEVTDAATPTINSQPQGATYGDDDTVTPLSVTASVTDRESRRRLTYQGGGNTADNTTEGTTIDGATSTTYTPPTTTAGTVYYYVLVTNTNDEVNGTKTAIAASDTAAVVVIETPYISNQPAGATYTVGGTVTALSVTASVTDGGTLTYQWFSNTANNTTGGTAIDSATSTTYTPPTTAAGTVYYYVVVTNTKDTKTATATSAVAAITVTGSKFEGAWRNQGGQGDEAWNLLYTFTGNQVEYSDHTGSHWSGTFTFTDTQITFIPASGNSWTQSYSLSEGTLTITHDGKHNYGLFQKQN
jgi:hypothetical protein